jgi:DNA-binding NarL/FixJ family response regulator
METRSISNGHGFGRGMTMARTITVLLADDHVLFRQALRHLLDLEPDIEVIAEAGDGASALALADEFRPDVALLDISMPAMDGIAATTRLREEHPEIGIIILTMFAEDAHVIRAIRAGANGYLLKNTESSRVVDAIRAVARGQSILEPQLVSKLLDEFRKMSDSRGPTNIAGLTERELDLLRLVAQGLSNKEIASNLELAESTVKNRLSVLFEKLEVKDRTQAAIYAMSHGLIAQPV